MSAISGPMNMGAVRRQATEQGSSRNMALMSGVTTAEALTRQSCRSKSVKSTSSSVRRRELLAKERLAQAEVNLARIELERIQCEEEECSAEEPGDNMSRVEDWLHTSQQGDCQEEIKPCNKYSPQENEAAEQECSSTKKITSEVEALTIALKEAMSTREGSSAQPKFIYELPFFDGNIEEWLAFKVMYEDTAFMFSSVQNMARLRRAIKGNAKEAIKSLLFSDTGPDEVMRALGRRYGRPDALVMAELDKIRSLQRISENPSDICAFANQINNSVATIRGLKKPYYLRSPEMSRQILDKLPSVLKFRWYDYAAKIDEDDCSDLESISTFLNNEADKCGAFATVNLKSGCRRNTRSLVNSTRQLDQSEPQTKEIKCPLCQGNHFLVACQNFRDKSTQDRWVTVKSIAVCFKCLRHKFTKGYCRSPPCKICRRGHHTMLHYKRSERLNNEQASSQEVTIEAQQINTVQAQKAYLKMIRVEVFGSKGSKRIMALLDEGSTVSLLNADVSQEIGLSGRTESLVLETVGGKRIIETDSQKINLKIKGIHQNKTRVLQGVRTVQNLKLASQLLEKTKLETYSHLREFSDTLYYEEEPPQLLIGQDNWEFIISREVRKGKPGQPVASMTKLGWVLHGLDMGYGKSIRLSEKCAHVNGIDDEMHMTIKEHFSIEALGVQPKRPSTDSEGKALALLEATCKRLSDGRFEAGLLWKNKDEIMPNNYTSAENRLKYIEKKLDRNPELKMKYNEQIQKLIENKYAEEAPIGSKSNRLWYLPHFSVEHPVKRKLRIVFDAAARYQGKSLNDALLPGPDLLQSLFGVLLRFRQGPYAVAADIREMFLQIRIKPDDRDSLRFLWRGDRRDIPPIEYRMTSVVFGATSSPSIAIYVKNKNAADFKEQYPEAFQAIDRNHYMDDYLHSFHTEEEFLKVTKQVDVIHKKAGFELRGWTSNKPSLLNGFNIENPETKEVNLVEKEEKTLGLRWLIEEDTIGFRANLRNTPTDIARGEKVPTKREVTSAVMSTFDPLGLASPILIQGKKLLQHIWRSGVDWDDKIENSIR
ncbi:PREDICTED: uncharacterized protein LOC106123244 [Papilio xuthus]|uniref:Uncharacterized protein LOC106123244 n=1 Tax=Papilio xuthus TaxID=66420 RepID=A0AAJ6ZLI0_PAPXU|nr:PREDICTED: uncharacterized protein LOC106123244 [Papilio xuthus]